MSRKAMRPLAGLVLAALVGALVVVTATPATAHYPQVEASSWCDPQGQPWIIYRAWSWKQDPANDGQSGNPDIGIYVEGLSVDGGEFTAGNGYEFGGSIPATDWAGSTVTVRAQADAPFNNGSSLGSFRETLVHVPVDCLPDEPGLVAVSVLPGACRFEDGVSRTPVSVSIEPDSAAIVVISDTAEQIVASLSVSGTIELSPGTYSWVATPSGGFELNGIGAGELIVGSCEPQEPSVIPPTATTPSSTSAGLSGSSSTGAGSSSGGLSGSSSTGAGSSSGGLLVLRRRVRGRRVVGCLVLRRRVRGRRVVGCLVLRRRVRGRRVVGCLVLRRRVGVVEWWVVWFFVDGCWVVEWWVVWFFVDGCGSSSGGG